MTEIIYVDATKPFAGYRDFDHCVAANQEQDDPEAYCAEIMRRAEGKEKAANRTGAMLALYPPRDVADALALSPDSIVLDPESPEELHVTLAYFGDAADLAPGDAEQLAEVARDVAAVTPPITGVFGGEARFSAPEGEPDAYVLLFDSPAIGDLHDLLTASLPYDVQPRRDHGFTPHLTLAYVPADLALVFGGRDPVPATFKALTLVIAGERQDFPLVG